MSKLFKKNELKILWPFYLKSLLQFLMIFTAFYVIQLQGLGLSLFQIGVLFSVWGISELIFEIPTGAIADIYGRKFSTILGFSSLGAIMVAIYFSHNFYSLLTLFFLMGIAGTFFSGADDAWVVDLLKRKRKKDLVDEYFKKIASFSSFAMLLSGAVGAFFVGKYGLNIIWIVTGAYFMIGSMILLFGEERFIRKKQHIRDHLKDLKLHTKEASKFTFKKRNLSLIMYATFFFALMIAFAGAMTWQPFLLNSGLEESYFGYLFFITFLLGIFIPYTTNFLTKKIGSKKIYLVFCLALVSISLFLLILTNNLIFILILFFVFMSLQDFYYPVHESFFHSFVPGKMRATIGSFKSLIFSLVSALIFPLVGFLADKLNPKYTIILGGIFLIPSIIFYMNIDEK
jgi:MFS family permease